MKRSLRLITTGAMTVIILLPFLAGCAPKNSFPLSEPGTYDFGTRGAFSEIYAFIDTSRDDRKVSIMVWYPAILPVDAPPSDYNIDVEPDFSGAPYPLILSSAKVGHIFGPHLASHGFVVVGVKYLDYYIPWDENLIDQPLDILFALDQVASNPLEGLEGMVNAENAGVMGYSFDGYNALAMSGARLDPQFYMDQCANADYAEHWNLFGYCDPSTKWDQFTTHAGEAITTSNDGLWQPMTDERIRAVMPMGPEGAILFGERGLAAVDRPILVICGTDDVDTDYNLEAAYIYNHLGTPEKSLISFVGEDHYMIFSDEPLLRMKHFATAFFGYHLQGQEEYADYFSKKFVSKREGLAWGVYEKK